MGASVPRRCMVMGGSLSRASADRGRAEVKTEEWNSLRRKLKKRFAAVHITRCEVGFADCWGDNGLSFAHAKKRRNLKLEENSEVVLACLPCHDKLESLPEYKMTRVVRGIIDKRVIQP